MSQLNPTLITFLFYLVAMIGIGLYAYKSTQNYDEYILGGRSLGSVVTALSAGASDMSGWLLMGLPGAIYVSGLSASWIAIGLIIGAWLNWYLVAGRLRMQTEYQNNALTLPDYFTSRFDDHRNILRVISALVILVFFAIYCASGMVAGARLFESLFGWDYTTALWIGAIATIAYVCIGGFLAISWTDTFQAGLMIFALLLTPIVTYLALGNHAQEVSVLLESARPHASSFVHGLSGLAIVSSLAWGLGYFGQPHILVRFMAAESVKTLPAARRIGMIWMSLCLIGAMTAGYIAIAYFKLHPELAGIVNHNPETVFMELTKLLFNPWIAGIVLAAILAAVMSTLSCQLLVCSTTLTEDLYKGFIRKHASQKELIWIGRSMVVLIALGAIAMATNPESKVLGLVSYAWAGFGAAFGPLILLSLFWKRMTLQGAIAGMIVGAITVVAWKTCLPQSEIYEIIPGFILATLSIIIVSLMSKAPNADMVERFEQANIQYEKEMQR